MNSIIRAALVLALLSCLCPAWGQAPQPVIPAPGMVVPRQGEFRLSGDLQVRGNLPESDLDFLRSCLVSPDKAKGASSQAPSVTIRCLNPEMPPEQSAEDANMQMYAIEVAPQGVMVTCATPVGAYYAVQTLAQMMRPDSTVAAMTVQDVPRLPWRGILLDSSRHFWPKEVVMRLLDRMGAMKLNRLHLHLTDAGGWRMESDLYPELTQKTAYRTREDWQRWWLDRDRKYCPQDKRGAYGGFYTKQDLRDIVDYAAPRGIVVVPEIEMPGHSEEVTYAYPELSCSGVPGREGELCIGQPKTYEFLEGVLDEVMEIFPSRHIHIGGDECSHKAWEECPRCQGLMKREGIATTEGLQAYLTDSIGRYLAARGRCLIGWDEIMEGSPEPGAAVMSWRGAGPGAEAALRGHRVVMSPAAWCYLDQPSDTVEAHRHHPSAPRGPLPLGKVYEFDPVPQQIAGTEAEKLVMGIQGNLWTEWVADESTLNTLLWPRAAAIAQTGWSRRKPALPEFLTALRALMPSALNMGLTPLPSCP